MISGNKKILPLFSALFLLGISINSFSQTRYLDEVFTNVNVSYDVVYGNNITVQNPTNIGPEDLLMDVYEPVGDSLPERPLVLYIHTGSFLPLVVNGVPVYANGGCTGDRTDSATVEMANQFAMRGYTAVVMTYRVGWNPFEPTQTLRIQGLLNAAYRGIQDARTCVRYFRSNYATGGNTFSVDTSKIIMVGQGTGGYLSLGCATLDKMSEINIFKFLDGNGNSVVDTAQMGDYYGMGNRPLNIENHSGYSSRFHMAVNLGGALGDSSWLEGGENIPIIGFHCPNDPFGPYGYGMVIVPTTNENVVEVSGSHDVVRRANKMGLNDILLNRDWGDAYSAAANGDGSNIENLFPLIRPQPESAPWEWWDDGTCPNNTSSIATNPDMSEAKGLAYIDTIQNYLAPRIACVFNLSGGCPPLLPVGLKPPLFKNKVSFAPNPAHSTVTIQSSSGLIEQIVLYDAPGREIFIQQGINSHSFNLNRQSIPDGLYFINVKTNLGLQTTKIIFQ